MPSHSYQRELGRIQKKMLISWYCNFPTTNYPEDNMFLVLFPIFLWNINLNFITSIQLRYIIVSRMQVAYSVTGSGLKLGQCLGIASPLQSLPKPCSTNQLRNSQSVPTVYNTKKVAEDPPQIFYLKSEQQMLFLHSIFEGGHFPQILICGQ